MLLNQQIELKVAYNWAPPNQQNGKAFQADLMSLNRHFMEHGQPHAWADFNPMQ